jgi:hypothetical protein
MYRTGLKARSHETAWEGYARWEDNVKRHVKEIKFKDVDCIRTGPGGELFEHENKTSVSIKDENFLTIWEIISFSRRLPRV